MFPDAPVNPVRDRFRGALVGTLVGDALGMPVEGWPGRRIRSRFGEVRQMRDARLGAGTFTDDTQMAAALAEGLLESDDARHPDLDTIARSFGRHFDPERGYGGNTRAILAAVRSGAPWREVVEERRLPGGSFANGAAMRVAPAALAGYPDPAAVARIAEAQCAVTGHDHPEARFGARLQAVGVLAGLLHGRSVTPPGPRELLEDAADGWEGDGGARPGGEGSHELSVEDRRGEKREVGGGPSSFVEALEWIEAHADADPPEVAAALGNGVRAVEAVSAALWAFLGAPDDPEEAVVAAVGLGGDTDTIGAMTGALAGARNGASAFPDRWLDAVERGEEGLDGLVELADRLFDRVVGGT